MRDSELLFYQVATITIALNAPSLASRCYRAKSNRAAEQFGKVPYEVMLLDWDAYTEEQTVKSGTLRVEEELIRQTMNAEKITITNLLLEPGGQPLEIERQKRFIEAELRYME